MGREGGVVKVGSQRVWDYAGDNYVHRLIQTKEEGKLVEFVPPGEEQPPHQVSAAHTDGAHRNGGPD